MYLKYIKIVFILIFYSISAKGFAKEDAESRLSFSGNISVASAYINRGMTNFPENEDVAIQSFLKLNYQNFYISFFNSKLGYSFSEIQKEEYLYRQAETQINPALPAEEYEQALYQAYKHLSQNAKKVSNFSYYENDFFIGYENSYAKLDYDVNLKYLYYPESNHTGGLEAGLFLKYPIRKDKDRVGISFETYLNDVYFMNKGDTYIELNYATLLYPSYYFNLYAGFSYFDKNGTYVKNSTEDFVFRHTTFEFSHAFDQKEQAIGWMQYIVGGKDRFSERQKNLLVAGLSYNF